MQDVCNKHKLASKKFTIIPNLQVRKSQNSQSCKQEAHNIHKLACKKFTIITNLYANNKNTALSKLQARSSQYPLNCSQNSQRFPNCMQMLTKTVFNETRLKNSLENTSKVDLAYKPNEWTKHCTMVIMS